MPDAAYYAQVVASVRRATWLIILVLGGIVGALGMARIAGTRREAWALDNREAVSRALATELSATIWESAARLAIGTNDPAAVRKAENAAVETKSNLDSLAAFENDDPEDSTKIAAIRQSLATWEQGFAARVSKGIDARPREAEILPMVVLETTKFDTVRSGIDAFIRGENAQYHERIAGQSGTDLTLGIIVFGGALILTLVVLQMRKQLHVQLAQANESHRIIEEQNRKLRLDADALEKTADDLRAAEHRQHALADEAQRLSRRLAAGNAVARLGYWEIDAETREVLWSDEMYRLCGHEPGTVPPPTDRYLDCVHPEDRQRVQDVEAEAVRELGEFTEQYRLVRDGETRHVLAKGQMVVDEQGRQKLVGTVQDITDRVLLETQLRQSQKMDAIGRLAGGVAHDFNNMLTVVGGYAYLLLNTTELSVDQRAHVAEIVSATKRAGALTQQLLTFSRGRVLQPRAVELGEIVDEMRSLLSPLIGEDVQFTMRIGRSVRVLVDPTQITQVLLNLVVNARDAMPKGGELVVETGTANFSESSGGRQPGGRAGRYAVITVCDTGVGMSAETQARIFDPFFTTKPEGQGTGLGLSTVFGIVRQSGGTIWVYSEPGQGTTFKVYLPEFTGAADAPTLAPPHVRPERAAHTETVLLVEDDAVVRLITGKMLARRGYVVAEAANGVEALNLLERTAFDLVLTDTIMPKMSGRELAVRLAAERPALPVILMSGYTADTIQRQGPIPDGVVVLEKPFDNDTLNAAIDTALQPARRMTGGRLSTSLNSADGGLH